MITRTMDAIVLAGGQGRRMGSGIAKPFRPLGGETLVERVLAFVRPRFNRVFVVVRSREGWDDLDCDVLTDDRPQGGPLVGLSRGLAASTAEWCFLVGCDMPFLQSGVVEEMAGRTGGVDAIALRADGMYHPLHGFYRRTCAAATEELLSHGVTSMQGLLRLVRTHPVGPEELCRLDPELLSFRDVDTPSDYAFALGLLMQKKRVEA